LNIIDYFSQHKLIIASHPFVHSWEYQEDIRTSDEGFFKGKIHFIDDSILEFREYVNIHESIVTRYTYSFHYHKAQAIIFRYDNTPHYPDVSSFPHHKHLGNEKVIECLEPSLKDVLDEIGNLLIHLSE